jgi:hypothetical protein
VKAFDALDARAITGRERDVARVPRRPGGAAQLDLGVRAGRERIARDGDLADQRIVGARHQRPAASGQRARSAGTRTRRAPPREGRPPAPTAAARCRPRKAATPRKTRKKSVGTTKSSAASSTAPTTIHPRAGAGRPIDEDRGVRFEDGRLQLGLTEDEIENARERLENLLADVEQSRFPLF